MIAAIEAAKKKQIYCLGFTGMSGGKMKDLCDIWIAMPSSDTPRIQEALLAVERLICDEIEKRIFKP